MDLSQKFNKYVAQLVLLLVSFVLSASAAGQGLSSGSLTLYPNSAGAQSATQTVTMGIPFAACTVRGADRNDQFVLFDESDVEVAIFIKETLTWPDRGCAGGGESTRALKVQFVFDATDGNKVYSWDLSGRTTANDISEVAIAEFTTASNFGDKGTLKEPVVFAIHDNDYLVQSQIIPPTVSKTTESYDTDYYPAQWEYRAQDLDFTTSTTAHWLFDRTTANYRQAIRREELEHYREAYLSHEFYVDNIDDVAGSNSDDCIGAWGFGSTKCDSKYVYLENMKVHLALTGDDSWEPDASPYVAAGDRDAMFSQMASILYEPTGRDRAVSNICLAAGLREGLCDDYDEVNDRMTERHTGFTMQALVNSCELTADAEVCGWADELISRLHDQQTTNIDGLGNDGFLRHSWEGHESNTLPWVGTFESVGSTTFTVDNALGDEGRLTTGDTLWLGASPIITLTADAIDLGGGRWQLTTDQAPSAAVPGVSVGDKLLSFDQSLETDRGFSPWMLAILADGVWQYYNWIKNDPIDDGNANVLENKAKDLLLGFGQALTAYALDGVRINPTTKTAVEGAFGVTIFDSQFPAGDITSCSGLTNAPFPRYVATTLMSTAANNVEYMAHLNSFKSDQHIPDTLFLVALGIFFETDMAKKAAMQAVAADMVTWFDSHSCTATQGGATIRIFNWQNKMDPFGTLKWAESFSIAYDTDTFTEKLINDGTIDNDLVLTLGGAKFSRSSGDFVDTTDYTVAGLPAGFTGVTLTATSDSTATLTLDGTAASHQEVNDVSSIVLTFTDSAFADGFPAARVGNFAKSDLAISFRNPELDYVSELFVESTANDGSISNSITVDLKDDTFTVTGADLVIATHYTLSNLPSGLTAKVAINGAGNQATISFTGTADDHANVNDEAAFGITFTNAAFVNSSAADIINSDKNDIEISFFEPALAYGGSTLNEDASTNIGEIGDSLDVTLSDDTFAITAGVMTEGVHYSVANEPAGLSVVVTGTSATTATIGMTGSTTDNDNIHEIANLTVSFLPAAFSTVTSIANVTNATNSAINIAFVEPALSYASSTFSEAVGPNNGSISNSIVVTVVEDTFAVSGGVMSAGVHYTAANVPAGLNPIVTGTSSTTATIGFTGSATNNANANEISNLGISFLPAAFVTSTNVTNLKLVTKSDFVVEYVEPSIMFTGMSLNEDPFSDDGSINETLTLNLSDDTFVMAGGNLLLGTHFQVLNLPPGLVANIAIDGTGTQATVSFTGMATQNDIVNGVMNFTLTFLDPAFTNTTSTGNISNVAKNDIVFNFVEQGINYDFNTFVESNSNVGAIGTVLNLSLVGETFTSIGVLSEATHYTVAGVPPGLTVLVTTTSNNQATLALTGTATDSDDVHDTESMELTFLNAAFTGGDASAVPGSSVTDLAVDFVDAILSLNTRRFKESDGNKGKIKNLISLSLVVDTFATVGTLNGTHYTIANVPAGLTAVVTTTTASQGKIELTGNATAHKNVDGVIDLTINFLDAAFTNGAAADVENSSVVDIVVDFDDPGNPDTLTTDSLDLDVTEGESITNVATITNLQNSGTVVGGKVGGTVSNAPTGKLVDVELVSGTTVSGGKLEGAVKGSGTLTDVLLDATSVDPDVVVGRGTKVSRATTANVPGLNLTESLYDAEGVLRVNQPLLVEDDGSELSVLDISLREINSFFGNDTTDAQGVDDGDEIVISNPDLANLIIPMQPQKIETTNEANGLSLNKNGDLVIIGNGIKSTFAPSAADLAEFQEGITGAGAETDVANNGLVTVVLAGQTFTFHFSYNATAGDVVLSGGGMDVRPATFAEVGSPSDPRNYRIIVDYGNGSQQSLVPYVHDIDAFETWVAAGSFTYSIDLEGIITITSGSSTTVFKGIPNYALGDAVSSPSAALSFTGITDHNGDGVADLIFESSSATQIIFGIN